MEGIKPPEITVDELLEIDVLHPEPNVKSRTLGSAFRKYIHEFTAEDEDEYATKMGENFLQSLKKAGFAIVKVKK